MSAKKKNKKNKKINKRKRNPKSIEQWNRRKKKKLLVGGEGKFCQKQIFSFLLPFSL